MSLSGIYPFLLQSASKKQFVLTRVLPEGLTYNKLSASPEQIQEIVKERLTWVNLIMPP